ncbi:MAG TPA: ArsA-related P-loop ATPase [Actinomycetota bacterium]|nr:ArsA-related P-loop ATPase [Actinomycetota bacterium]
MTTGLGGELARRRIVVVCGSGGVGKTTVSAAIAVGQARAGRRTVVMTVDPARRLVGALGLPRAPGEQRTVRLDDGTELDAIMLDTKRTFDELVARNAGSAERRDAILNNGFYRRMSDNLSGTHEYMAMERLYELATDPEREWDAIVVDTPPTRSALSFLDAPKRMLDFLGGRMFRWLLWPYRRVGKAGIRGMNLGARALGATVGRIAGADLLRDTAEFLGAFEGMYDGFRQRAQKVQELMGERHTGFVVVAAPDQGSLQEAGHFVDRLSEAGMHLAGVVVNRSRTAPAVEVAAEVAERLRSGSAEERATAACVEVAGRIRAAERRGAEAVAAFRKRHPVAQLATVPELPLDVHDRLGVDLVAGHLLGA